MYTMLVVRCYVEMLDDSVHLGSSWFGPAQTLKELESSLGKRSL